MLEDHTGQWCRHDLAVHDEPFRMPFGEITLEGSRVVAYREKPTYRITICSAVTDLGAPRALSLMVLGQSGRPAGVRQRLLDERPRGPCVRDTTAAWVDVNDWRWWLGPRRSWTAVLRRGRGRVRR